jgi:hypothetical protein
LGNEIKSELALSNGTDRDMLKNKRKRDRKEVPESSVEKYKSIDLLDISKRRME